ncbi:SMP-30/gluconolactonase/LRE family protein [Actinokineospora sp. NPDC004072]
MTTTAHSLAGPARAPVWCGQQVTWLDQTAERLRVGRLTAGALRQVAAYAVDGRPLSALPCRTGWLVATPTQVLHLRRDGRQTPTPWPAATLLTCDPGGRLWLATPTALLRADLTGRLHTAAEGPTLALAWNPAATTLYRATPTGIHAHPYDLPNGHLSQPVPLSPTPATSLAVDRSGHLWAALPTGIHRMTAPAPTIPVPTPTGCCITTDTLLISTPTGLHSHTAPTGGRPATLFAG